MIVGRIAHFAALGSLVTFLVTAFPLGGGAAIPSNAPLPCGPTNMGGSIPVNANNPLVTHKPGGGFNFSCTSTVTWDCTTSTVTPSGCSVCAATRWYTSTTLNGTQTPLTSFTASAGTAACGSTGNTANFTDTLTGNTTDGLYYHFYFAVGAGGSPCPDATVGGNYRTYDSGTFQNN